MLKLTILSMATITATISPATAVEEVEVDVVAQAVDQDMIIPIKDLLEDVTTDLNQEIGIIKPKIAVVAHSKGIGIIKLKAAANLPNRQIGILSLKAAAREISKIDGATHHKIKTTGRIALMPMKQEIHAQHQETQLSLMMT